MATNTSTLEQSMVVPAYPIWRLSVSQYHDMIQAGILTEDDPVELLEGWLVTKMTKNSDHSFANDYLGGQLASILPSGWCVKFQNPITTRDSEPEPDIAIVRGKQTDYRKRHPYPEDIALTVEISDSSLQQARTLKLRIYARARIPTYWIVNLQDQQLEVYGEPFGEGAQANYRQRRLYTASESVPVVIEGREIGSLALGELLV